MNEDASFEVVFTQRRAPEHPNIPVLIWWASRFAELGFTPSYGPGDHGNLSCRTERGLLITARQTAKASLQPDQFMEVVHVEETDAGTVARGIGLALPSTDTVMHWRIYERRPDVHAILHGHDAHTLANAQRLRLPVTRTSGARPSGALIEEVCELARRHDYLLMRDHGFVALGPTIDEAGDRVRDLHVRAQTLAKV